MKKIILFLFIILFVNPVGADSKPELLSVLTAQGGERFKKAGQTVDFFSLANQFESQTNRMFCGPTTVAIVLNALRLQLLRDATLKVTPDESLLAEVDRKYLDPNKQYVYNRYTQNNVFVPKAGLKTKLQVLGEPMPDKPDWGLQLRQLHQLFLAHRTQSKLRVVNNKFSEAQIRKEIIKNLGTPGDYVVVNYHRSALGQGTSGHISPVGAYDEKSDSLLLLDVNPNSADWVWVPFQDLIAAMKTFDTAENRGYLLVSK
ncbi:MAG: hypothetical protein A3F82_08990 [Deltaproteobacteria bacterium RIFCSPLOWO2_12_FULL_44_12]|nr:MAG: hypothetical protein A2712_00770 [Deltaproteobacteria bacterium RIFCSPHIGHO2_01_FULL_43_49]OGQ14193.1 MAG: hypothetical protein A3D22_09840 [Deltaproteobacteria bacterium RIFCSPHIGHO2_02_FULL_44_53]OGQ27409.1 MAG: hypothetical protein A3D98_03440 [Deltaproteobacteria bacterium RIFCSPHIGHO2_12_FULL_44_21]OGQ30657.1 MAG: hypothetical protein A2979_05865 [Deltaproteobacteria bacterium RIFCSPLOWO2_01_FULL_45_74]OGQ42335.1 MAG: hypothetical protein A3I70_02355 [Deltaproteobacteria bacterium 